MEKYITVEGAREHNLKNISVKIPRDKLVVITGLSGSGKSSLAFDTIYAEGQRRYVESLSAYARQFLSLMEKPDVERIEGLSPAVAIQQRKLSHNPRSTVATATEIYDYLRLLFARIGTPHCWICGKPIVRWTVQGITDEILSMPEGHRIIILSPIVRSRKGEHKSLFEKLQREGFLRVRVDGVIKTMDEQIRLDKNKKHDIELVVDRLVVDEKYRGRLAESIETALQYGDGLLVVLDYDTGEERFFSEKMACPDCGTSIQELSPRMFSFNSPYGACKECSGLGVQMRIDPELIVPDENLSLIEGAIVPWRDPIGGWYFAKLKALSKKYDIPLHKPWKSLTDEQKNIVLYGSPEELEMEYTSSDGHHQGVWRGVYEGVIPNLERRYRQTDSANMRAWIERFMISVPCSSCGGSRLRPESRAVTIAGKHIHEIVQMSVKNAHNFFSNLMEKLTPTHRIIAEQIVKEIRQRLRFLCDVGVGYLTLDRITHSLSGGEAQRIHLATQIGSGLVGVLYVLDEPTIGLHAKDTERLMNTLERLRDLGNTIIIVEHDRYIIRRADYIVDLGPGAGTFGGNVVAQGTVKDIEETPESYTGQYLTGKLRIKIPERRRAGNGKFLVLRGASGHNLKNIDVKFPLGKFICITGVSGSGKSTLINETLYPILARYYHRAHTKPLEYREIIGLQYLDKVIDIDQSPIGRTPRSNPSTYTGVFTPIRELFASLPESRARGYKPGRFSFNVKGGRCEACSGDGMIRLEMHFLPDVYIHCDVCKGKRYNRETLEIKFKGHSIADVLDMTVDEALTLFENIPPIVRKLQILHDVGLGYIRLGQPAPTLSGGEAQRVKLAKELTHIATGNTLYILDEPTVGLHAYDVKVLLSVLDKLVEKGNTIVVIEHNLDVIAHADWVIDLGPEGGEMGGKIVAEGTPEDIAKSKKSITGKFLKKLLK
ncbi:excinuclease ABC subunit UvrA [bacterium]|nr:MAG: excinuclease ABC subunit UvrA [bacterium]